MKIVAFTIAAIALIAVAGAQSDSNVRGRNRNAAYEQGRTRTTNPNAYTPPVMVLPLPKFQLVLRADVRGELKIDTALSRKIAEATLKAYPKNLKTSGDPEGQWRGLLKTQDEAVIRTVDSPTRKRLNELWMQYNGYIVASEYDVAKALELTDDQREQIAAALKAASKRLKEAQEKAGATVRANQAADSSKPADNPSSSTPQPTSSFSRQSSTRSPFADAAQSIFRKEVNEVIAKILTDTQRANFEKMSGEKFKFVGADVAGKSAKPTSTASDSQE